MYHSFSRIAILGKIKVLLRFHSGSKHYLLSEFYELKHYNKSMRIGIYDPYLDDCGGGEKYMMSIAECLAFDNKVDVFWDSKEEFDAVFERFSIDRSNINQVPNIFKQSFFKKLFKTKQYDALIVLSDGSIPITLSKKLFIHIQQPLKHLNTTRLKDRLKIACVSRFFCNSNFTAEFLKRKLNVPLSVLYPPVTLSPQKVAKENIILHVGRYRIQDTQSGAKDYKKQGFMIETFKKMVDEGLKKWKFVLAVSVIEPDREAFKKMQHSAKGYPIEFLVNLKNDDLWQVYSKAAIYWHASGYGEDLQKNPQFAEHFGISTVEAMGACAVPVVINAGGQKEIISHRVNGLLWDAQEEFISMTHEVIEDKKLWEKLSHAAKKRAEFFGGDRFCRKVRDLIQS